MKFKFGCFLFFALVGLALTSCPSPVGDDTALSLLELELPASTYTIQSGDILLVTVSWTPSDMNAQINWDIDDGSVLQFTTQSTGMLVKTVGARPGSSKLRATATGASAVPVETTVNVEPRVLLDDSKWIRHRTAASSPVVYRLQVKAGALYELKWRELGDDVELTGNIQVVAYADDMSTVLVPEQDVCDPDHPMQYQADTDQLVYVVITPMDYSFGSYELQCVNTTPVESISIACDATTVESGTFANLSIVPYPVNSSGAVSYASDDPHVVHIGSDGRAYALAPGVAAVTAVSAVDPSKTDTIVLTVVEQNLPFGEWVGGEFLDDVHSEGQSVWYSFQVEAGRGYTVSWNDSNSGDGSKSSDILVTGYASDKLRDYFYSADDGYASEAKSIVAEEDGVVYLECYPHSMGTYALRVDDTLPIGSVVLSEDEVLLLSGATHQLEAMVMPAGACADLVWSSNDPSVVEVSTDGFITAKKPGTAQISATSIVNASMHDVCTVEVSPQISTYNIWLTLLVDTGFERWYSFETMDGYCYELIAEDRDSHPDDFPADIEVAAYDTRIENLYLSTAARLDGENSCWILSVPSNPPLEDGGRETIVVRIKNYLNVTTGAARFKLVSHLAPAQLTVSGESSVGGPGSTAQMSAEVFPSGAPQSVRWYTSDPSIATVDDQGLVTVHAVGGFEVSAYSIVDERVFGSLAVNQ